MLLPFVRCGTRGINRSYFGATRRCCREPRLYRPVLCGCTVDASTAHRVHRFVANSRHVAARIRRCYNRAATIVYPPVDTVFYQPAAVSPERHFLIVSAFVPYKRLEIAIDACRRVGAPLRIVGDGPDRARLERRSGPDVTFLGAITDEQLRDEYQRARALIMPGEEDFGIVPVEAQACGRPVVALGRGGACETVTDGETGVLFSDADAESLAAALRRVEWSLVDGAHTRKAERFSRDRLRRRCGA